MSRPLFSRRVIFAAALITGFLYGLPPSMGPGTHAQAHIAQTE